MSKAGDIAEHSGGNLTLLDEELHALLYSRFEKLFATVSCSSSLIETMNKEALEFVSALNMEMCSGRSKTNLNVLEFKAFRKYEFEVGLKEAAKANL